MAQRAELEVVPQGKTNDGKFVSKLLLSVYSDPEVLAAKSVTGAASNNSKSVNRRQTTAITPSKLNFIYG